MLPASAELHTASAVERNFFRHPDVRHDREPHSHEVARLVCKGAERFESLPPPARSKLFHELPPDPQPPCGAIHDERANLGDLAAERRQLGTPDDRMLPDRHDEASCVPGELVEMTRQEVSFGRVCLDERIQRLGIGWTRRPHDDLDAMWP